MLVGENEEEIYTSLAKDMHKVYRPNGPQLQPPSTENLTPGYSVFHLVSTLVGDGVSIQCRWLVNKSGGAMIKCRLWPGIYCWIQATEVTGPAWCLAYCEQATRLYCGRRQRSAPSIEC